MKIDRVLVTGARLPAALEIVRAVSAEGVEVWSADSLSVAPAGVSTHVAGYLKFPSPAFSYLEFRAYMQEAVRRLGIQLVIPVSEEVFFLAQMAEELRPAVVFAPPIHILRGLHSKWKVLELASQCGARIPRTMRTTSNTCLHEALEQIPDGVLKPEFSRGTYETLFPPHKFPKPPEVSEARPWLLQEKLEGREMSTYCVAHGGRVLVQTAYEPLYRVRRGASLYFQPVHLPAAEVFVENFVRKNGLTGQISFDFMEEENGGLALIECNPRASSGVHLIPPNQRWGGVFWGEGITGCEQEAQACAAKLAVLFEHALPSLRAGRWRAFLADIFDARDSLYSPHDLLPSMCAPLSFLEIVWRSRDWRVKANQSFTHDLEWNG